MTVAFKQVHYAPPPPRLIKPSVPVDWEALILKALARDPADRFQTAAALVDALSAVGRGEDRELAAAPGSAWSMPASSSDAYDPEASSASVTFPPLPDVPPEPETLGAAPLAPTEAPASPPKWEPVPMQMPPLVEPAAESHIQVSAYYPKEVRPHTWYRLYAYVSQQHVSSAVVADAQGQLGSRIQNYRERGEKARQAIAEGALVAATPYLEAFQFNPPRIAVRFFEDWHRLDFRLRAEGVEVDRAFNGFLTFTVEGVIIADIPLSIYVGAADAPIEAASPPRSPYEAIFCSYSHRDEAIVRRVEQAYRALGLEYLRDVTVLKSGQRWSESCS